jgi:hypothetical protein
VGTVNWTDLNLSYDPNAVVIVDTAWGLVNIVAIIVLIVIIMGILAYKGH